MRGAGGAAALTAALVLLSLTLPGVAAARPGDAIVVDSRGVDETGSLVRLDPRNGRTRLASTNLLSAQAGTPSLAAPEGIAVATDGTAYVADPYGLLGAPAVFAIDPMTGKQRVFSANGISARRGGRRGLRFPTGLAIAPDGDLLVVDYARRGSVIRIDRRTRQHRIVTSGLGLRTSHRRIALRFPSAMALDRPDRVTIVADSRSSGVGMVRVNLRTGRQRGISRARYNAPDSLVAAGNGDLLVGESHAILRIDARDRMSVVSNNERSKTAGGGEHLLAEVSGIAVSRAGTVIVATRANENPDVDSGLDPPALVAVDPLTGSQRVLGLRGRAGRLIIPGAMALDPTGEVLVVDRERPFTYGPGTVLRVDPGSGSRAVLTSSALTGVEPGDQRFSVPTGVAFERTGTVLVTERFGADDGAVIRVDLRSGRQTVLASRGLARKSGGRNLLDGPRALALERDGSAIVVNAGDLNFTTRHVVRVDARTGRQTLLASNVRSRSRGTPGFFREPAGVAVGRDGTVYVVDLASFGGTGGVIAVDPRTGRQRAVTSNRISRRAGGARVFSEPNGLALDGHGGLYVTDRESVALIRIQLRSGRAIKLSTNEKSRRRDGRSAFAQPRGVALTSSGDLLVTDRFGRVIRVDARSGRQTRIFGGRAPRAAGGDGLFAEPAGVVIEPRRREARRSSG